MEWLLGLAVVWVISELIHVDKDEYPPDSGLWHLMVYCAGTGGSLLIIGSAAGVAVMGMEKISFGWYLKRISGLALIGYVAGAVVFFAQCSIG